MSLLAPSSASTRTAPVPIAQLQVGMDVVGIDKPWYATPFLRHRFRITDPGQIAQLQACGVRMVTVQMPDEEWAQGTVCPPEQPPIPAITNAAPRRPPAPSLDRQARELYLYTLQAVSQAFCAALAGRTLPGEAIQEAAARLVTTMRAMPQLREAMQRLVHTSDILYHHAINGTLLAIPIGVAAGMTEAQLQALAAGMLLHDIGHAGMPMHLLFTERGLKPYERDYLRQHVARGVAMIRESPGLPEEAVLPVQEHHERLDGSGYPTGTRTISGFGRIAALVDQYCAMTSPRPHRAARPPVAALRRLLQEAERGTLDWTLVGHFIKTLTVYPVGSCVELATGEIAVVTAVFQDTPLAPRLCLVCDPKGERYLEPLPVDLRQEPPGERQIVRIRDPHSLGIDPADYLEPAVLDLQSALPGPATDQAST